MGIRHIDYDKCTDGERRPVITYLQDCQSCFLCEKYCPAGAIAVSADRERRPILPWKI